jgi:hypothetical protein
MILSRSTQRNVTPTHRDHTHLTLHPHAQIPVVSPWGPLATQYLRRTTDSRSSFPTARVTPDTPKTCPQSGLLLLNGLFVDLVAELCWFTNVCTCVGTAGFVGFLFVSAS